MSKLKFKSQSSGLLLGIAVICAIVTTACGSGLQTTETAVPTKQGTIALDALRVGTPESSFKEAIMSFAQDQNGTLGGKTQYLSRTNDANGGQYMSQCKDGVCFGLQVLYPNSPITTEQATEKLKQLFPSDLPPQSSVDDQGLSNASLTRVIHYGDIYRSELVFTDKSASKVKMVSAWIDAPQDGDKK